MGGVRMGYKDKLIWGVEIYNAVLSKSSCHDSFAGFGEKSYLLDPDMDLDVRFALAGQHIHYKFLSVMHNKDQQSPMRLLEGGLKTLSVIVDDLYGLGVASVYCSSEGWGSIEACCHWASKKPRVCSRMRTRKSHLMLPWIIDPIFEVRGQFCLKDNRIWRSK